jgi:hypothetical protein
MGNFLKKTEREWERTRRCSALPGMGVEEAEEGDDGVGGRAEDAHGAVGVPRLARVHDHLLQHRRRRGLDSSQHTHTHTHTQKTSLSGGRKFSHSHTQSNRETPLTRTEECTQTLLPSDVTTRTSTGDGRSPAKSNAIFRIADPALRFTVLG